MSGELDANPGAGTRSRIFPMSHEQQGLWIDDALWDGSSRHVEAWVCRITGRLDVDALEWALSQIVARHEVLRTRLTEWNEEPVQMVTGPDPVRLEKLSCPSTALDDELGRIVGKPLDLGESPMRSWLVRVSPDEVVLVVQLHHAVIDDWSLNIFQRELKHFYTARVRGLEPGLEPLPVQAGELAIAQRAAGLDPTNLDYWRERVRDAPRSCTIPPARAVSGTATGDDEPLPGTLPAWWPEYARRRNAMAGHHAFEIGPELGQAVRDASRALRTTPFGVFAAAMAAMLWQYGESDEVIFGTPMSLRGSAEVDDVIGVLIGLLPMRLAVTADMSFRALARGAKAEILGAMQHRGVPYPMIVQLAREGTAPDAPPPCDVAIVVDDMEWEPFSLPDVTAEVIRLPERYAKFALQLNLVAGRDGGYSGEWNYEAETFDPATVAEAAGRFLSLLAYGVAAPDEPLGRISAAAGSDSA
ncbi:condensation domain-containing protein [Micromonospora sp. NPDC000663]|uniref:condensation domain-containing protein n=1 Tax=Micromonospora sp. NPDC000663 TaxID=3364218 RepID=UPI003685BCC8